MPSSRKCSYLYCLYQPLIIYSTADSTLINGLGRSTDTTGVDAELAVISVTQGKRYRFRLVSMSCDPNHTFSIDGHNMTIIEVDGINHTPLVVDELTIYAGQRYSFVVSPINPSRPPRWPS